VQAVRTNERYGWVPDLPDHRDQLFAPAPEVLAKLPASADLRPQCPPVYDQGKLGSCTANAISAAMEFDQMRQNLAAFMPSRLFIYYNERAIEGTVASDSGAQIRDGIKSVGAQGVCPESEWPYEPTKFADKPTAQCYSDALANRAIQYQRVARDLNQMKGCLVAGFPFVFGFSVYDSFESAEVAQTGHAPMPAPGEGFVSGHAVMAVGYEDAGQWLIVRNSWGPKWGMAGHFTLPYAYVSQRGLASDFWTVRVVQ
jgi:C1A family cysteine protease